MEKRIIGRITTFLAALVLLCSQSCANLKDIRDISIRSFDVRSLSIKGFDSADAVLEITVENPARDISVSSVEGTAYRSGKPLGAFSLEPFSVKGRSTDTVTVNCSVRLDPSLSPLALMSIATEKLSDGFTMDITIRARIGKSPEQKVRLQNVPLENIVKELYD